MWNQELTIARNLTLNDTLFIEFMKRTTSGDLVLGLAGMPIYEL